MHIYDVVLFMTSSYSCTHLVFLSMMCSPAGSISLFLSFEDYHIKIRWMVIEMSFRPMYFKLSLQSSVASVIENNSASTFVLVSQIDFRLSSGVCSRCAAILSYGIYYIDLRCENGALKTIRAGWFMYASMTKVTNNSTPSHYLNQCGLLSMEPLETNVSENWIDIQFSHKMILNITFAKCHLSRF